MPKSEILNKSTKILLNYLLGISLFVWLTYSIYTQLMNQANLGEALDRMLDLLADRGLFTLLGVILLMLVNWGLEARKWQFLVKPLEDVPFRRAFMAILSGVSLSINTPNRIGEYGGRILYVKNRNKLKAIAATVVGSFSQLIVTALFGLAGLIYYLDNFGLNEAGSRLSPQVREIGLICLLVIVSLLIILLYFRLKIIVSLFEKVSWLRKAKVFIQIIARYSPKELRKLLLLSAVRYIVFSAQYLILLYVLGVELVWWQGLLMISTIYLVMAVVPTIAIAELGLRGRVSIYFLGLLSPNTAGIIAATVAIWLINLILPAAMGSILLLGVKIFKEK
ncbi:flippase-like domain-containing protein [Chitinophaga horti]|uniref:Flippase-like domain-containing protein n=1 Tax=Chitinophaga horti TaxID=2920382 RepID=A0ABY6J0T6_9BACT|nr:lysylphosphatidylglycerol synthase transmembrane domain-containing protein [Chitinophaga horti]UYQ93278.1 flippase-like domain-containing protein [Chitinophaga horti]